MNRILSMAAPAALLVFSVSAQDNTVRMKIEQDNLAEKVKAEIQVALERSKVAAVGGIMGRVVKGAPYSAQEVNESTQTLADGTRIHNESRITVYRDGEGRVRRESGDGVTIWDPVANVSYTLNPKSMTATKTSMAPAVFMRQGTMGGAIGTSVGRGVSVGGGGGYVTGEPSANVAYQDNMIVVTRDGKTEKFPAPPDGNWTSADGKIHANIKQSTDATGAQHATFTVHEGQISVTEGGLTHTMPLPAEGAGLALGGTLTRVPMIEGAAAKALDEAKMSVRYTPANVQQLGEEVIEGVKSRGTRSTSTLEAGAIGNDRALTTVVERWYSDELQMEVLNRRTDPRSGENTFRLINVNRSEPGSYLFQVPNGYTVNERK